MPESRYPGSVSVGITAHNEEATIANLLDRILAMSWDAFVLDSIIVVLDACTDRTHEIVMGYKSRNSKIRVISDGKHTGKAARLNQIYETNTSDFLVTLDADIDVEDVDFPGKLLKPFKNPEVVIVAGNNQPLPGRTFLEKMLVARSAWWYRIRKGLNGGNNPLNSSGQCFALRKSFIQSNRFMPGTLHDEYILYLMVMSEGKMFAFSDEARIRYREASTWKEFVIRARRYAHQDDVDKYAFEIDPGKIPQLSLREKVIGLWDMVLREPVHVSLSVIFLIVFAKLVVLLGSDDPIHRQGYWRRTESTKVLR